jgi:uncharacterized protein
MNDIKMGELMKTWKDGEAKNITFCVTEDCNLACKYCYMTGKNSKKKMSLETAKKAVDCLLSSDELLEDRNVVWEFIGGEPFLEIELIDRVTDYIKLRMYELDHPWFESYRLSFSTNGILYGTDKVQRYIKKNKGHISVGISVDGNRTKHDLQRVYSDGKGSYDDVVKNVPLWLQQFPESATKATFAHDDLKHLKESIINLWDIGIKIVAANVVFEDVWHDGDDIIFENQLKELADYVLDNEKWRDCSVRFFDKSIGFPLIEDDLGKNWCGAGRMIAVDVNGVFFPCVRFYDFALNNRDELRIGDMEKGLDFDRIRPFYGLSYRSQSKKECLDCDVATGCAWCTGFNYDAADSDTVFQRATFNCRMHKANVRACNYFWDEFGKRTGLASPRDDYEKKRFQSSEDITADDDGKYLFFITSDDVTPHCDYRNWHNTKEVMDINTFNKGLEFAGKNGMTPVFLGHALRSCNDNGAISIINAGEDVSDGNIIGVYDNDARGKIAGNCILLISRGKIGLITYLVEKIRRGNGRVNIVLENVKEWEDDDVSSYKEQLGRLSQIVYRTYAEGNPFEINVLTDVLNLNKMSNCDAGKRSFTLAPNGKFYICPAFYFDNPGNSIGDVESGMNIRNHYLLELENAEFCMICDAYQCKRCKFLNKKYTGEINTPTRIQCLISHIEREESMALQILLMKAHLISAIHKLEPLDYCDPMEKIKQRIRRTEVC